MPFPVEYVPDRQEMQVADVPMAVPVEYVPATHETQPADVNKPVPVLYLPAGQTSQFTPDQLAGGWVCVPTG